MGTRETHPSLVSPEHGNFVSTCWAIIDSCYQLLWRRGSSGQLPYLIITNLVEWTTFKAGASFSSFVRSCDTYVGSSVFGKHIPMPLVMSLGFISRSDRLSSLSMYGVIALLCTWLAWRRGLAWALYQAVMSVPIRLRRRRSRLTIARFIVLSYYRWWRNEQWDLRAKQSEMLAFGILLLGPTVVSSLVLIAFLAYIARCNTAAPANSRLATSTVRENAQRG